MLTERDDVDAELLVAQARALVEAPITFEGLKPYKACPVCFRFLGMGNVLCDVHKQAVDVSTLDPAVKNKVAMSIISQVLDLINGKKTELVKAQRKCRKQLRQQMRSVKNSKLTPSSINIKPIIRQLEILERQCRDLLRAAERGDGARCALEMAKMVHGK